MITHFKTIFTRGLDSLKDEVAKFSNEEALWQTSGDISNCSGTLALHLVGNMDHFIGALYGKTGYVRQRDKEFSERNVPKERIIAMIDDAKKVVEKTLDGMKDADLSTVFPAETFGPDKSTHEAFLILIGHFQYHLGQINYLRRVVSPIAL